MEACVIRKMEALKKKSGAKKEKISTLDPPPEIDLSDLAIPKDDSNNNSSSKIDNDIGIKKPENTTTAAVKSLKKKVEACLDNARIHESLSTPNTSQQEKCQEGPLPIPKNSLPTICKNKIEVKDCKIISQPLKVKGEVKWKRNIPMIPTLPTAKVQLEQPAAKIKLGGVVEQTGNAKVEPQLQSSTTDVTAPAQRVDTTSGHIAYLRALQKYWKANEKLTEIRKQIDCISIESQNESKKVANNKKGWKRINFFRRPKSKVEELTSHLLLTTEAYKGEKAAMKELRLATLELQRATQNCIPTSTAFEQRVSSKPSSICHPWEDSKTAKVVSVDYLWNMYEGLNQLINPCPVEGKMSVVDITETAKNLGYSSEGRRMFFDKLQTILFDISESLNFLDAYRYFLKHLHLQTSLAKASKPTEYSVSGFNTFQKHFNRFVTSVGKLKTLITLPTLVDKVVESGIQIVRNTVQAKRSSEGLISGCNSHNTLNRHSRQEFISKLYKSLDGNFFKQLQSNIRSMDVHIPRSESQFWKMFATPNDVKNLVKSFSTAINNGENLCVDSTWNLYEKPKLREIPRTIQEPIVLPYSWDYLSRLIATKSQTELLSAQESIKDNLPLAPSYPLIGPLLECTEGLLIPSIDKRSTRSNSKRYRSPPPPPEHLLEWQFRFPKAVQHDQHSSGKHKHVMKVKNKHKDKAPCPVFVGPRTRSKTVFVGPRTRSKTVVCKSSTDDDSDDKSEESSSTAEIKPSTALQNVSAEIKYWARRKTRQLTNATNRVFDVFKRN